mgnify:CR=1 FL=1
MNEILNISTNAQIASALILIIFLLMYIAFGKKSSKSRK